MNRNFTQNEVRDFISKVSDFFKMFFLIPAALHGAGNFMFILNLYLIQLRTATELGNTTFFRFVNRQQIFVLSECIGFQISNCVLNQPQLANSNFSYSKIFQVNK